MSRITVPARKTLLSVLPGRVQPLSGGGFVGRTAGRRGQTHELRYLTAHFVGRDRPLSGAGQIPARQAAAKAGIQLRNAFVPAGTLFGSKLPNHDFDLAMFTYLVTVDPHYVVSIFSCGNASNYTEYCNRNVTKLLAKSDQELNDKKRLALILKVGKIMGNDVPMIPLYQRPTYLVYKTSVKGLVDNASSQGPSFNAENWSKG